MGKKLYVKSETGIKFKSSRKPGEVRIPNYVYDLWIPLVGAETIGVYAVYCRLEREGTVKGMSMSELARACKIGKSKLQRINKDLERCGFIKVTAPTGQAKLMHWTNEIEILDPPCEVSQELAAELLPGKEHELLAPWLMEEDETEPPEVPNGTAVEPNQNLDVVLDDTANIESLGLQPSDVAKEPPAFDDLQEAQPNELPPATDGHQLAVDRANGSKTIEPAQEVAKHLFWGFERGPADLPPGKEWKKWHEGGKRLLRRLPKELTTGEIIGRVDTWFADADSKDAFWHDNPLHDTALDIIARFVKNGGTKPNGKNRDTLSDQQRRALA